MLIRCPRRLNAVGYQSVSEEGLLPLYATENYFMQDGVSCHRASSKMNFWNSQQIRLMNNWPAQSPHLNIIENLWVILKEKVACHSPRNLDELWNACELEWASIGTENIKKLYDSIPSRIEAVLRAKGLNSIY